ncbi:conjugal transfer protein TraA, partial [Mesorhizobium sp. M2D.F.Ca.ET.140.01.1.1]
RAAEASRPIEARLAAVAQGSQPAVVKMASYGAGARVGAMLNYVSRGGELAVENENGERISSREDLARLRGDWNHLFQNRAESR